MGIDAFRLVQLSERTVFIMRHHRTGGISEFRYILVGIGVIMINNLLDPAGKINVHSDS